MAARTLDIPETSKVIEGTTYHCRPLSARRSLAVMTRVLKMAAPGFGDVASLRQAAAAVGTMLSGLAENLDEDTLMGVCDAFAEESSVELTAGKQLPLAGQWDEHFRGDLVALFGWLRFCAEVNFGPLVVAAKAALPAEAPAQAG